MAATVARILGAGLTLLLIWQDGLFAGLNLLWLLAALLFLFGMVSRVAALLLTIFACVVMTTAGLQLANALLMTCTVAVLHLGGGRLALWSPEDWST